MDEKTRDFLLMNSEDHFFFFDLEGGREYGSLDKVIKGSRSWYQLMMTIFFTLYKFTVVALFLRRHNLKPKKKKNISRLETLNESKSRKRCLILIGKSIPSSTNYSNNSVSTSAAYCD